LFFTPVCISFMALRRSSLKGGISFDEDALSKTPGGKAQRRRTPSRDRIVDSSGGEPDTTPDGALTDASLEQMVMDIHVRSLDGLNKRVFVLLRRSSC
jgi:hypothetical protein